MAVGQQGAAVQTAAVEDGHLLVVADDDEINIGDERVGRTPILELAPLRYPNGTLLGHRIPLCQRHAGENTAPGTGIPLHARFLRMPHHTGPAPSVSTFEC